MWPYWLDGRAPGTVRNSFQLGSMALLTGAPECVICMSALCCRSPASRYTLHMALLLL